MRQAAARGNYSDDFQRVSADFVRDNNYVGVTTFNPRQRQTLLKAIWKCNRRLF